MAERLQELFRQSIDADDDSWITSFIQNDCFATPGACGSGERTAASGGERTAASESGAERKALIGNAAEPDKHENRWILSRTGERVDTLSMAAVVSVTASEFFRTNPDALAKFGKDPARVSQAADYKLLHASTGEIDGGWRIREVDGDKDRLVLTKTYNCQVEHRDNHDGLVEVVPGTASALRERIEKKLAELPPNVISALQNAGYKIILTNWIEDAMPSLKGLTPRGWDRNQTFRNSDGTEDNVTRRIVIPAMWVVDGQPAEARRRDEVVHQIGHALDFARGAGDGFLSAEKAFVRAYEREIARLDKNDDVVRYFSQPGGAGRQEVFATLFGLALTGPEIPSMRKWLSDSFPETLSVVGSQIRDLK